MPKIMQGDQYSIPITLKAPQSDGSVLAITPDMVHTVEFMIGGLRRVYPDEINYDYDTGAYLFPVTQEETFRLSGFQHTVQVRILFTDDTVVGAKASVTVGVDESRSKVILE